MRQQQFENERSKSWSRIATLIGQPEAEPPECFPVLYRGLCQDLALARQRGYAPSLIAQLHDLTLAAHRRLYGTPAERPATLRQWLGGELPRQVRQHWGLLLLACGAFWGLALAVGLLVWQQPHWAYAWMDASDLARYRQMYQPDNLRLGRGGSSEDIGMFGFYIWNNLSIGFRTFAGGLFLGLPALISLIFNGMHFGVIAAWLSRDAATRETFWSFVVTHSSFEIIGLLLAALAGMRLGLALIRPGRASRRQALIDAGRAMFPVLVGAALLILCAAFFEAFWSANPAIPPMAKYVVGGICWLALIAFFLFAGRRRALPTPAGGGADATG